jgi:guanylate kinase
VSSTQRSPKTPARSLEQRLHALARANQVRYQRAQLKRELAAGARQLAPLLANPPAYAQTATVRDLMLAVPGIGPARANRALVRCRIAEGKTIAGLSSRQRGELIELLQA